MNLVVDIGNTTTKIAVVEADEVKLFRTIGRWEIEIENELKAHRVERAIISSVAEVDTRMLGWIQAHCQQVILLDHTTPLPLEIVYRTPHTLGIDRIAAAVGAITLAGDEIPLLVIDAGTAITYEVVTAGRKYKGGNISPGIAMRLQALHNLTARLPLIEVTGETPLVGYDTQTAIRSGVVRGVTYEIEGYISQIREVYPDILIFLTGGDAFLLAATIKNRIFVDHLIVIKGLNSILDYNANT